MVAIPGIASAAPDANYNMTTGEEATARKVISKHGTKAGKYSKGSLFILYPQGAVTADITALKDKAKDIGDIQLERDFTRVADRENGVTAELIKNLRKA